MAPRKRARRAATLSPKEIALLTGAVLYGLGYNRLSEGMLGAAFPNADRFRQVQSLMAATEQSVQHLAKS